MLFCETVFFSTETFCGINEHQQFPFLLIFNFLWQTIFLQKLFSISFLSLPSFFFLLCFCFPFLFSLSVPIPSSLYVSPSHSLLFSVSLLFFHFLSLFPSLFLSLFKYFPFSLSLHFYLFCFEPYFSSKPQNLFGLAKNRE